MSDRPWPRRVLTVFVLPGLFFGLLTGLQDSSLDRGIVSGIFFSILFGGSMLALSARRTRSMADVPKPDRRRIMTLVGKGEPITDPRLAPAVLEYTAIVRRAQGKPQTLPRMTVAFVILSVVILVVAVVSSHPSAIYADAIILGLWLFNAYWLPAQRAKVLDRVAAAETQARELLATEPGIAFPGSHTRGDSNGPRVRKADAFANQDEGPNKPNE